MKSSIRCIPRLRRVRADVLPRLLLMLTVAMSIMNGSRVQAQEPVAEANAVAAEVLARSDWMAAANQCPSTLMRTQEATDHLDGNNCKAGQLKACLSKCSAGQPGACYWLAVALQQAAEEKQAGEVLYQQACALGVMSGCTNRAAGVSKDMQEDAPAQACAVETFSKACAFDDPWACTMYASHLSRGVGTVRNEGLALKVLGKSCKYGLEDPACAYGMRLKKRISGDADGSKSTR
jgi:hypothetical protein